LALVLSVSMFPPIATLSLMFLFLREMKLLNTYTGLVLPYTTFALPLTCPPIPLPPLKRNKKLAEIQRRQSRCQKGSRQWKKYERAKKYILSKSERQLRDALHKTTKQFVDWCRAQSVSDVYIGNVEGIQRHTRKKKRASRKQAQKLSNWSFGKTKNYLAYKLAQHGIRLKEMDESYTSQTCPVCRKRKKVSGRMFVCSCGYEEHRDIHGARNILSKAVHGHILPWPAPTKLTYLRIA
jgi:putative transposase